ncbi:MAG: DUF3102 domain-containing protein [Cyanobacteria bacterium P01_A01_bin.83]
MFVGSVNNSSDKGQEVIGHKYLVVDDEIAKNEVDKEDFILDIGVDKDLALFASNYEEALRIINLHGDIAICFIDSKIPKNERDLYSFEPNVQNNSSEWGISLIPEINKLCRDTIIVVYSAYVTKTYLKTKVKQFNNIKGFFGKPGGIKHRQKLYLEAITAGSSGKNKNDVSPSKSTFDYSVFDEDLSAYLREKTTGIKQLVRRSGQDIIDIGQSLIDVKGKLEHGQFYLWLETEIGLNYRTANRFMSVAERFKSEQLLDLDILPSALYELSAPSVPETATEEALLRAKQGEKINVDTAKKIKSKHVATDRNTLLPNKSAAIKNSAENTVLDKKQVDRERSSNSEGSGKRHDLKDISSSNELYQKSPALKTRPSQGELPTAADTTKNPALKQQIIKIIPQQNLYLLGEHLLFCGDPNSPQFTRHLTTKVSLNLAFPNQKNWIFSFEQADSEVKFYSRYGHDLDFKFLLEAVERYIKITTDGGDDISICFIPHPDLLLLAHQLGCRCFISEPDHSKCEAVVAAWKEFKANNQ